MRIAIQQEIQRSDESRYDHRLHGLLLVTGGESCRRVARLAAGADDVVVDRVFHQFLFVADPDELFGVGGDVFRRL